MRRWRWGGEGGTLWLRALRERKAGGGGGKGARVRLDLLALKKTLPIFRDNGQGGPFGPFCRKYKRSVACFPASACEARVTAAEDGWWPPSRLHRLRHALRSSTHELLVGQLCFNEGVAGVATPATLATTLFFFTHSAKFIREHWSNLTQRIPSPPPSHAFDMH